MRTFLLSFSLTLGGFACWLLLAQANGVKIKEDPIEGWFGNCLRCEWDPWGGPAYCAIAKGAGFWGCYASGYKCQQGGHPCGKKAPTPAGQS